MTDDTLLPFALPSVQRKKLTAAFDGGRLSSDAGVMLLGLAERRIGVAEKLAAEIADPRDRSRVVHSLADILRALHPGYRLRLRGCRRPRPFAQRSRAQAGLRSFAG